MTEEFYVQGRAIYRRGLHRGLHLVALTDGPMKAAELVGLLNKGLQASRDEGPGPLTRAAQAGILAVGASMAHVIPICQPSPARSGSWNNDSDGSADGGSD